MAAGLLAVCGLEEVSRWHVNVSSHMLEYV